ncbi:TPA: helix-hairpin-helix domain-containing protein [Enterobacter hormaechei]|nr:helix-hairpin-helix domain-containing protein [Enterobacter hormaechei]
MGIFDFIFRKTKRNENSKHLENTAQAPAQYINIAAQNKDIIEGMQFHATCQLRTPIFVLKKHGEVFKGDGTPPAYGSTRDGIWVPKLRGSTFDFLDKGATSASDAGPVNADEYVDYAIGLLEIFESSASINDKMTQALAYAGSNESKKRIEMGLLRFYGEANIADVMSSYIPKLERFKFYLDEPNKLTLVNGVSEKIAASLKSEGVNTLRALSSMNEYELTKIKGIGKITAQKIINSIKDLEVL